MQLWFPEASLARSQIMEDFANHFKTNQKETRVVEVAKRPPKDHSDAEDDLEAVGIRVFSGFYEMLRPTEKTPKSRQMEQFVYFLLGEDPPPKLLDRKEGDTDRVENIALSFGTARIQRLFQSFSPEVKAAILSPFLTPPGGIMSNPASGKRVLNSILKSMEGDAEDVKLILEGTLYAIRQVAPHEETLTLSYLLAQSAQASHDPGLALKQLLESQGTFGKSLGQKLFQRRVLPDRYTTHLGELQDNVTPEVRFEIFQRMSELLGIEDLDPFVEIDRFLGRASAKTALKADYKDASGGVRESSAFKMLPAFHDRRVEVDLEKAHVLADYLEKRGGRRYRRLQTVVKAVENSVRAQSDLRADSRNLSTMQRLYPDGVDAHGVRWHLVKPLPHLGIEKEYSNEEVAEGTTFRTLPLEAKKRFAASIFLRGMENLFGDFPGSITFTYDLHMGNIVCQVDQGVPVARVIDYPLVDTIERSQRDGLLGILGYVGAATRSHGFLPDAAVDAMVAEVDLLVGDRTKPQEKKRAIREWLSGYQVVKQTDNASSLFDLFATLENHGVPVPDPIYNFVTEMGNVEGFTPFVDDTLKEEALEKYLRSPAAKKVRNSSLTWSLIDRCRYVIQGF
jgi:predicted unusual protein kinase regulating ubiquinone biosynthesis (AarF/ABC1/UbiB family)